MSHEPIADIAHYSAEEVLRDGGSIHVRALRPDDRERLLQHFRSLSQDSIYHRFFGLKRTLTDEELIRLTKLDFVTCRNLLIYLDAELQKKLMPLFHYSLNSGGILLLGSAETVGTATDLFTPLPGKTRPCLLGDRSTVYETRSVVMPQ